MNVLGADDGCIGDRRWMYWGQTRRECIDMSSKNTFVPTVFRHTLIFVASRKLAPLALRQCSSDKAKYIEKPLHSLSFLEDISMHSLRCVLAKHYYKNCQIQYLDISINSKVLERCYMRTTFQLHRPQMLSCSLGIEKTQ